MRVGVPGEQKSLKKKHARRPHRWRSAEPRQEVLSQHELHGEQKKGPEKNSEPVRRHFRPACWHWSLLHRHFDIGRSQSDSKL
jgi:hypothetical protein